MKFSDEEERFLEENEIGRLATICADGMPHVFPVCYIYRSGGLWGASDYDSKKYRNLLSNDKVVLVVDVGFDSNRGMLVQGHARIYEKGSKFREIYRIFHKKFNWVRADPQTSQVGLIDSLNHAIITIGLVLRFG
jgi:nitroimidazol reductase NimA-like FMN-containing flavoprotein (pyridoxamine 5'-phosphate oxidase superfamily)